MIKPCPGDLIMWVTRNNETQITWANGYDVVLRQCFKINFLISISDKEIVWLSDGHVISTKTDEHNLTPIKL